MYLIEILKLEALDLWKKGCCWNALGKKYSCSGDTVKERLKDVISDSDRQIHQRRHKFCDFCYSAKISENQISLF